MTLAQARFGSRRERDLHVDALRGLFLVIMTVNHLPTHPIQKVSAEPFGYVSAAEGFFCLSGYVAGWLYSRYRRERGAFSVAVQAWRRCLVIASAAMVLAALMFLVNLLLEPPAAALGWHARVFSALLHPSVLLMYTALFLVLPAFLWIVDNCGTGVLFALSGALWITAQFHWLSLHFGPFDLIAWQLPFMVGLGFGCLRDRGVELGHSRWMIWGSVALIVTLFTMKHQRYLPGDVAWPVPFVEKGHVQPLRLAEFLALAVMIQATVRKHGAWLASSPAHRALRILGQHSLQVFCWSEILRAFWHSLVGQWQSLHGALQCLLALISAATLWLAADFHQLYRRYRRREKRAGEVQSPANANPLHAGPAREAWHLSQGERMP